MTLMYKDWCYAVGVYDEAGELLKPQAIEEKIWSVIVDVNDKESRGEKAIPIGVFTADDRDLWTKVCQTALSTLLGG